LTRNVERNTDSFRHRVRLAWEIAGGGQAHCGTGISLGQAEIGLFFDHHAFSLAVVKIKNPQPLAAPGHGIAALAL